MYTNSSNTLHTLSSAYLKDREKLTDRQKSAQMQKSFWEDFLARISIISAHTEDDLLYAMRYCNEEDLVEFQRLLSDILDERHEVRNMTLREIEELEVHEVNLKRKLEELDEEYAYQKKSLKAQMDEKQR
mgnify:FL=1